MSTWQDIATAPKDGKPLLMLHAGDGDYYVIAWWDAHYEAWTKGDRMAVAMKPTHWMPLPAPPQSSESNARIVAGPMEAKE